MAEFTVEGKWLTIEDVENIISSNQDIKLSDATLKEVERCRVYLDEKIKKAVDPIYGINTGFGSLYDQAISNNDLEKLQENLLISHSCGMGDKVDNNIVKLMLLLKVLGLSVGKSAVQTDTIQRLVDLYNHEVYPVVYEQGSLGASGDLAPLSHLCLPIINRGEVEYKGEVIESSELNKKLNWEPVHLKSKEGLALINGTQFMSAHAVKAIIEVRNLLNWAELIASVSLEAYDGRIEAFDYDVHAIRNHKGQQTVAKNIRENLKGSEIISQKKKHVQDPYSFRCIPQVHGATRDFVDYATGVIENEINAVTDNPTVFPDEDKVISAGNFHGQPLAVMMDQLAIAFAEIGSISERRVYKLISGQRDLPSFLVKNPGLNSGFMIAQYAAASVVSQNKQLATPACVDTIDSSNGQEDHVSMGANSATKLMRVVENVKKVLAVELFNACQAIEFRRPLKSSDKIEKLLADYRKVVPTIENDVFMHPLIEKSIDFINTYKLEK